MCKALNVSTSGYYKWGNKQPTKRDERKQMLIREINLIYYASKCRYGSPRIAKELNMQGIIVSKVFVAKLMRQQHLKSIVRKKYKVTTDSSHKYPVAQNILNREFNVAEKNKAWVQTLHTFLQHKAGFI
jgi:putative transposase